MFAPSQLVLKLDQLLEPLALLKSLTSTPKKVSGASTRRTHLIAPISRLDSAAQLSALKLMLMVGTLSMKVSALTEL